MIRIENNNRIEKLKGLLVDNALALIIDHNVSEQTVGNWIKDALYTRVADLPKVPVAINTCYGGFGVCKHFRKFMKRLYQDKTHVQVVEGYLQRPIHDTEAVHYYAYRIAIALAMPTYGQHICQDYPEIALLFSKSESVKDLLETALQIMKHREITLIMRKNLDHIKDALNSPYEFYFAREEDDNPREKPHTAMIKNMYFSTTRYTRADLQSFIEELDVDLNAMRCNEEAGESWISIDERVRELALSYIRDSRSMKLQKQKQKQKIYDSEPFMDVVDEEGLTENTWSHMNHIGYRSDAMQFLALLRSKAPSSFDALYSDLENLETRLGLFCVSHDFSKLEIVHTPQRAHFSISEYDGLESISHSN